MLSVATLTQPAELVGTAYKSCADNPRFSEWCDTADTDVHRVSGDMRPSQNWPPAPCTTTFVPHLIAVKAQTVHTLVALQLIALFPVLLFNTVSHYSG